jgi:hypothetical protein
MTLEMTMNVRVRRITELFVEGTELLLDEDEPPTVLWLKKLNVFEEQECRLDGQAARSDKLLELRGDDNRDMRIARATIEDDWDIHDLVNALVNAKLAEFYGLSKDDVDGSDDWKEHRAYLERYEALASDSPDRDPEGLDRYNQMSTEFNTAILEKLKERQEDYRLVLTNEMSDDERAELYYKHVRDRMAMDAFARERRITEVWYCVRDCSATVCDDLGKWDHTDCKHERLFDRAEIVTLPRELFVRLVEAIDALQVPAVSAGNSAAPTSSSDSSEQSNAAEAESTASSQEATPNDAPST